MKQQKIARGHSKRKSANVKEDNAEQKRGKTLSLRQIRHNYSTMPPSELVLHHSKSGIINKFSQQFLNKFKLDYAANQAIASFQQKKLRRLSAIQAEISKINLENTQRIEELAKMEKDFIKRIQLQIKKDQQKQGKLKRQYEKLLKQEEKIALTKGVRMIKEKEDWVTIQKQQRKMQLMVKVLQKRHLIMGRDISHDFKKYQKKEKEDVNKSVGNDKSNKKQRKKKTADELKEMGRQFLEHAKKFQADNLKASTKLLDVYKKNIDYLPQMKVMLKSNAADLSKPIQDAQQIVKSKRKKGNPSRNTK